MRLFINSFLEHSSRSGRLLVLLGIQLTALVAHYPDMAAFYQDELVELCLQGFDQDAYQPLTVR